MKHTYLLMIALFCMMSYTPAQAQIWEDLEPIFEQMDETERENFGDELGDLMESWHYGSIELNGIVDSLFTGLPIQDPTAPIDSMLAAWAETREDLSGILSEGDLSIMDSLAVIEEYDQVNEIWNMNLDSLNEVMEQYSGSSEFSPGMAQEAVNRFEAFEGLWTQTFGDLQEAVEFGFDSTEPQGVGNLTEVLDELFSDLFDLEIAYGQEFADMQFYDEKYSVTANVIRVGSVPRFDKDWEARWHVNGSFFNATEEIRAESSSLAEGFNSFMYNGQFAIMYNPLISQSSRTSIRLYSSLGMEAATYVPPHVKSNEPRTFDNVGKTTGYGPQMGAGAIISIGPATLYTYGTLATGDVVKGYDYRFNSKTVNAGIRYGDAVNVMYTYGSARWAHGQNKAIEYSRVTVGVILQELFR